MTTNCVWCGSSGSGYHTPQGFFCTRCEHTKKWYKECIYSRHQGDRFDAMQKFNKSTEEAKALKLRRKHERPN